MFNTERKGEERWGKLRGKLSEQESMIQFQRGQVCDRQLQRGIATGRN